MKYAIRNDKKIKINQNKSWSCVVLLVAAVVVVVASLTNDERIGVAMYANQAHTHRI